MLNTKLNFNLYLYLNLNLKCCQRQEDYAIVLLFLCRLFFLEHLHFLWRYAATVRVTTFIFSATTAVKASRVGTFTFAISGYTSNITSYKYFFVTGKNGLPGTSQLPLTTMDGGYARALLVA